MFNLLLTSVGRRVELVRSFRRAYGALGLAGRIVATDIDSLAPAMHVVDGAHLVPKVHSPDYIPALVALCEEESINLVLPLIDPDIPVLADHRGQIEATGATLGVVTSTGAAISGDKWLACKFFRELGLATPDSWLPDPLDQIPDQFPLFIKPRNGSAAQNAFPLRTRDELRFFSKYVPNPIIQQHLDGPEITSDVVCDTQGNVQAVVSRRRIAVRSGEAIKSVTMDDPRIQEACVEIARALPAIGPITVQCMMHEGQPHFIEINARLGGGVPLAIAAGVDIPQLILAASTGQWQPTGHLPAYQVGLHMTRFDESFFLGECERAELPRDYLRS
ncbi:MAG: ATP-grasp domain-containing protein [Planctomycetales bacterium]|nr:ATP-grasp domain-containing protein [Planctomycetales bacterium]